MEMEMKITKSNAIINSSYRLSLNELRIVLYGLSHIDPTSDDFRLFHQFNVREIAEFFNIGEKDRGSFYDNIKDALIRKFWEREFSYYDETVGRVVKRRWLIEVQYGGHNGVLAYHYNPMIKNQLQQLAGRFTSYFLKNIASMKSAYAVRLYEISVMHLNASKKDLTTFIKTISDLKNHLDLTGRYANFFDFKRRILEKAKKEINKHSDIKFSYEVKKLGRSPNEIIFTVSKKSPNAPKLLVSSIQQNKLSTIAIEKAKKIAKKVSTGWDIYAIEEQFYEYIKKRGSPENMEAAFLGFVRKKVKKRS